MRNMKRIAIIIVTFLLSPLALNGYAADESLVVTGNGNVGIGLTSPPDLFTVYNKGDKTRTMGIRGLYPPISVDGTNYYKQVEIAPSQYNLAEGITDNGYRVALGVHGFTSGGDFNGTLKTQIGTWIQVGTNDNPNYPASVGTINRSVGLQIDNLFSKTASIIDSYGIYQSTTATKNYFAGKMCVGTTDPGEYKMYVKGDMYATRLKTSIDAGAWQDHVFEADYTLMPLFDLERFIVENKHLPEVPSAGEIEKDGLDTGEMLAIHMKKIEELTLYMIELKKENDRLNQRLTHVEAHVPHYNLRTHNNFILKRIR